MYEFNFGRMLAVAERDLRRFRRNRAFMVPMVLMPIVYLVILGQAMGGDLHHLPVALVDQDHGPAAVAVQNRLLTLQQSRALFRVASDQEEATDLLHPPNLNGEASAALTQLSTAMNNISGW